LKCQFVRCHSTRLYDAAQSRLLAQLYQVHELFARLRAPLKAQAAWVQSTSLGQGIGVAWVQTARGLLMH